ncbi:MAG: hypothetical protein D6730_06615 [Bacteroidetes bacterium]|nr:MAG: hypothetical protein D6730_06615 [Bacteroidota bacterium]
MFRKIKALSPAFLRKLDRQLLLHHPHFWATRLHVLLFVVAAGMGFMLLRAWVPAGIASLPDPELNFALAWIPAGLLFLLWVWQAGVHKTTGQYGQHTPSREFALQCQYLLGVLLIAALPYFQGGLTINKIARSIDDETLRQDIHLLNMGDVYFPLQGADYRIYPDHTFSPHYMKAESQSALILEQKQLNRAEKLQLIDAYQQLIKKYGGYEIGLSPSVVLAAYERKDMIFARNSEKLRHAIDESRSRIQLIAQAKYGQFGFFEDQKLYMVFFMTFLVWMSMMIFLRTSFRQATITLLLYGAGILLMGLFVRISEYLFQIDGRVLVFLTFFGALAFLSVQAFLTGRSRLSHYWQQIGLGLASLLLPLTGIVWMTTVSTQPGQDAVPNAVFTGVAIAFLVWQLAFNQQFIRLHAAPSTD